MLHTYTTLNQNLCTHFFITDDEKLATSCCALQDTCKHKATSNRLEAELYCSIVCNTDRPRSCAKYKKFAGCNIKSDTVVGEVTTDETNAHETNNKGNSGVINTSVQQNVIHLNKNEEMEIEQGMGVGYEGVDAEQSQPYVKNYTIVETMSSIHPEVTMKDIGSQTGKVPTAHVEHIQTNPKSGGIFTVIWIDTLLPKQTSFTDQVTNAAEMHAPKTIG